MFVAREALELEAYRRACSRVKPAELAELEALITQMRAAIQDDNFELYSASATNFRTRILEIAASPRLKELADSLLLITGRVVLRKIMIPLRGKSSLAEHEALFKALKESSVDDVELAFRSHMANLKADIERYWDIVKP